MIPEKDWKWFGRAGHFCAAHRCLFHLHTHVGRWCVSTVGEYYPHSSGGDYELRQGKEPTPLGASDRIYETMVFRLDKGAESPVDYTEREVCRTRTTEEAEAAHAALCHKYAAKKEGRAT